MVNMSVIIAAEAAYIVGEFRPVSVAAEAVVTKVKSWFTKQEVSVVKVVDEVKAKV
jgi:hypothetical protein